MEERRVKMRPPAATARLAAGNKVVAITSAIMTCRCLASQVL